MLANGQSAMSDNAQSSLSRPIIKIEKVEKTYFTRTDDVHALGPISLSFSEGETLGIVGPSGCGKSTLLRAVAGLEEPTSGKIEVAGDPVAGPVQDVGIVFQRDLLLDWRTVIDNVMLPSELRKCDRATTLDRAHQLLTELGVNDFAMRNPWELSGGMRQRVSIARALLLRPSILLLDEPFSALDALTRDQMNVILQRLQTHEQVSTLFITHSIPEAVFLSDRVIVMSQRPGRVLDDIEVNLPKPRKLSIREDPKFTEITRRIRVHFEKAGVLAG